jgi:acyl-CoA thioesterase I
MKNMRFFGSLCTLLLVTGTARAEGRVTCVGDSITVGGGTSSGSKSYPAVLQRLLGPSYVVANAGHSGATMLAISDLPYTSTDEYGVSSRLAALGGDVVIQLGTNDAKRSHWRDERFVADCKSMVAHYKRGGRTRVWLSLIPPATKTACCNVDADIIEDAVVPLLRTCAVESGISTIDVHGALAPFPEHFPDGVHPNDAGADIIARTVAAALERRPTIALSAVADGRVTLTAIPTAAYGRVERVVFFDGGTRIVRTQPPWTATLDAVPAGPHVYEAEMIETGGRSVRTRAELIR